MPKTRWRHYAENRVAPICRKLNGSITAKGDRRDRDVWGSEQARQHIEATIAQMRRFDKVRVPYFQMVLAQARLLAAVLQPRVRRLQG